MQRVTQEEGLHEEILVGRQQEQRIISYAIRVPCLCSKATIYTREVKTYGEDNCPLVYGCRSEMHEAPGTRQTIENIEDRSAKTEKQHHRYLIFAAAATASAARRHILIRQLQATKPRRLCLQREHEDGREVREDASAAPTSCRYLLLTVTLKTSDLKIRTGVLCGCFCLFQCIDKPALRASDEAVAYYLTCGKGVCL